MPGLAHLYIGEEAVAVGVCSALRRDDYITSTHRGHGHCLAKGADVGPDVRRAARQGGRLLQGQGRLDAHRRPANGNLGANAIVGGSTGIATGAAFSAQAARHRPGRRVLLRRRRARPGPALRGDEHGVALEAAGHLRLREQPLQRVHALPRGDGRRDPRPAAGVRHPRRRGRRPGRARRARRDRASSSSARGAARARPSCCATPTASTATTSATSTARTTARRRRSRSGATSATRSRCSAPGSSSRASPTRPRSHAIEADVREEIERASSSRWTRRTRSRAR